MAAVWRLLNLMQHEVCTRADNLQWRDLLNEFYGRLFNSHLDIQILENDITLPRNVRSDYLVRQHNHGGLDFSITPMRKPQNWLRSLT